MLIKYNGKAGIPSSNEGKVDVRLEISNGNIFLYYNLV
jgi:hypothetical protein